MDTTAANSYFATRYGSAIWDAATDSDKSKALDTADRQLKPYYYKLTAENYAYALYEQALWLMSGDARSKLQQAGVTHASVGNAAEDFQLKGRPAHVSPQAWVYCAVSSGKSGRLL